MIKKKSKNIKLNNKAKKKKKTQNKEKMKKSVFLYGNPNKEKLNILKEQPLLIFYTILIIMILMYFFLF